MARNEVKVVITGDADKFKKSLGDAESGLAKFSSKMGAVGSSMRNVGKNMTMGVTLPLVAGAGAAVKWAGELEDAQAMSTQVFGKMAGSMDSWASNSAKNFGLAKGEAVEWANQFGIRLRQIGGQTAEGAAKTSQDLTQLAGDFASAFGGSVPEAAQAIGSALTGEMEPLKRYGIVINDTALKNKIFEQTGKKVEGTLTAQQKQQATLALLTEQSSLIQGDYARNADGATNAQRTMTASLKDAATKIGTVLLPFVTKAAKFISELAGKFSNLSPNIQKIIVIVGVVVAALGPLIAIAGTLATAIGFIASPIGLVVAAIVGLVAAFAYFYKTNEGFRTSVNNLITVVKDKLAAAFNYVKTVVLPALMTAFNRFKTEILPQLINAFISAKNMLIPVMQAVGAYISAVISTIIRVARALIPIWVGVFRYVANFFRAIWGPIQPFIRGVLQVITGIFQTFANILRGNWSAAFGGLKNIVVGAFNIVRGVIGAAIAGIGRLFSGVGGVIGRALSGLANAMTAPFRTGANAIKNIWNSTIGGRGVTIPDIPGLPGRGQRFQIPRLHSGGIVPGRIGSEVPAILQAGEMVLSLAQVKAMRSAPARTATANSGTTYVVNVTAGVGDPAEIGRTIVDMVKRYEARNGSTWRAA